jgi:hypothetical protein
LILSFWNDSIFYIFLGAFPHLVGWVEPEEEGERGGGESGRGGGLLQENLNLKSKI